MFIPSFLCRGSEFCKLSARLRAGIYNEQTSCSYSRCHSGFMDGRMTVSVANPLRYNESHSVRLWWL